MAFWEDSFPCLLLRNSSTVVSAGLSCTNIAVADHAATFSLHVLHDVRVTQVQLDELS
jgi:hypothetical protein